MRSNCGEIEWILTSSLLSPVIEICRQRCLLPQYLLGYVPLNTYGHGKRMFTMKLHLHRL